MKKKIFALTPVLAFAGLALAGCSSSTRNSTTPYGDLDLNAEVAKATVGDSTYVLNNGLYYNRLRFSGNTLVTNQIKKALYAKELAAVNEVLKTESLDKVSDATKALLIPTKNNKKLFELDNDELLTEAFELLGVTNNYGVIRQTLLNTLNQNLSSYVFSATSSKEIAKKTESEKAKLIKTYIINQARKGINLKDTDLEYDLADDDNKFDIISFKNITSDALAPVLSDLMLKQAETLSSQNALHQIADQEYIKNYDADEDDDYTKNTGYYLYKDSSIESSYESSYQTYGKYHAIIIQFNSRKEAYNAVAGINFKDLTLDEAKAAYVALYNKYYAYKTVTDADDSRFEYVINENENSFSDLSDDVKNLIQSTLEDGDYLTEPRNLNNKYVMALRFDTVYDVSGTKDEKKYSDLDDDEKALYAIKYKYKSLINTAVSYADTNFKSMIYNRSNDTDENNDIFIYDPLFEHKFYNTYSTDYKLIDKSKFDSNLILKIDDYKYSVKDFYEEATKAYSNTVLTDYFKLEYTYKFYDEYVDSDTHNTNVETLETAIKDFEADKNASYSKYIGLETFLLNNYGYNNKEDVIKYYYDAQTTQSSYMSKKVFTDWVVKGDDGTYTLKDANSQDLKALYNLLSEGNKKYKDLFNINIDHFLINIDDDGDGSPDDPDEFLKGKSDAEIKDFEDAVIELARALYTEALYSTYKDNSLYKVLSYIKTQYEQGATLESDKTKNWDYYKQKYNFLLTVEQLASNGDITQDSVSNFVKPFADYVKGVFKTCVANSVSTPITNGNFYVYNTETKEGNVINTAEDATKITKDTICKTVFGYHILVLNSYSQAKETAYTAEDDSTAVQKNIQLLIHEDKDDSSNNIYVTMDSYNTDKTKISFNQFFIYYIQKANGVESSLSSNISTLMSSMYDDVISQYTSSNFQTVLLLDLLKINSGNETIKTIIDNERKYYANLVCSYADNNDPNNNGDIYYDWVFTNMDWTRPAK